MSKSMVDSDEGLDFELMWNTICSGRTRELLELTKIITENMPFKACYYE